MDILLVVIVLIVQASSLPLGDQLALANSLQVGRAGDPNAWNCYACSNANRPLISYRVECQAHAVASIISYYDDTAVLAFRYTANTKNVWQDLMFAIQARDEHTCQECRIQKQYNRMWEAIKLSVLNDLAKAPAINLIITGISLGGGLACVGFVDILHAQLFSNVRVVTFGAPRVGNRAWAEWFDKNANLKRYYIREDPIAFLPKSIPGICNYKPSGVAIRCDPDTQLCTELKPEEQVFETPAVLTAAALLSLGNYDYNVPSQQLGSIIDHIFGYKNIYNYTLSIKSRTG